MHIHVNMYIYIHTYIYIHVHIYIYILPHAHILLGAQQFAHGKNGVRTSHFFLRCVCDNEPSRICHFGNNRPKQLRPHSDVVQDSPIGSRPQGNACQRKWDFPRAPINVGTRGIWFIFQGRPETWLSHMRHDSLIWDMTQSYELWLIHVRRDAFMCDMTQSYEFRLIHVRRNAFKCDMTQSCGIRLTYVRHVISSPEARQHLHQRAAVENVCIYIYIIYLRVYIYIYIYMYINMCVCVCAYVHTYIHITPVRYHSIHTSKRRWRM